jgi:hypothetical protein
MVFLGDIVRAVVARYLATRATTPFQRKALRAIARCRTATMGSTRAVCERCRREHQVFRSCRNRHCPRCQAEARDRWLEAREKELLPVPYFHVVFTVPECFNPIALYCPEVFYAALLSAAGNALLDVGRSKMKAGLGVLAILHTWGQNLSLHPHVHCVVPGGGFSADGKRWISVRKATYLLPIKVLSRRFRTLLCDALREAAKNGKLDRLPKDVLPYATIEGAWSQEWIVYAKPPFGGPEQVLEYLSRYTHRVAISNRRIVSFTGGEVTFAWRDYADDNRMKESTIDAVEFVRRFLMHVLPDRFVRIRYLGFLANARRRRNIELARRLIGSSGPLCFRERPQFRRLCPACMALVIEQRGEAQPQMRSTDRSPPKVEAAGVVL